MNHIQTLGGAIENNHNNTPERILQNHLNSFLENDLEALMTDFTNESVLITQDKSYEGLEEIRGFYAGLIQLFPKQKSSLELEKTVINGGLVYFVWHGKSPSLEVLFATDTLIIKKGKIYRQTFAGQLKFIG
ncbi:MAG TPA: nuclear transport factor 2 family protein [Hanamia sp.]|nr:nuclear transport factor 2 family protein [Hanamia sp.]